LETILDKPGVPLASVSRALHESNFGSGRLDNDRNAALFKDCFHHFAGRTDGLRPASGEELLIATT